MPKLRKSKKRSAKSGPERVLVECSPHRTTGGRFLEELTSFPIEHESHNEKHALWMLPLCHDVLKISTQASKEPYLNADGMLSYHTPDIMVETPEDSITLEVKSLSWLLKEGELNKYLFIARGYLAQKKRFAFLVDAQLEQEPMYQSVNLLRRYVHCRVDQLSYDEVTQHLKSGPLPIQDLLTKASLQLVDVYVLIARKVICFDWYRTLDRKAFVSLPNQPYGGLKLENILRSTRYGCLLAELAMGRRPADQSVMADAANWRQGRQPPGPFQLVGGFSAGAPLHNLGEAESCPGAAWSRRDCAPGVQPLKTECP